MAKCKILFLAANPSNTETLRLDEEIREIKNKIRMSDLRDALEFTPRVAVRRSDLLQALNEEKPTIVHFSGHGSDAGEIYLQNDQKIAAPVSTEILADLFRVSNDDNNIKLVILNACYSLLQAPEIIKNVDFVIGMSREIPDQSARTFSASFYSALGFGKTIQNAFDQGKHEILENEQRLGSQTIDSKRGLSFDVSNLSEVPELAIPQLLVRDGCDPKTRRLVAPQLGWKELVVSTLRLYINKRIAVLGVIMLIVCAAVFTSQLFTGSTQQVDVRAFYREWASTSDSSMKKIYQDSCLLTGELVIDIPKSSGSVYVLAPPGFKSVPSIKELLDLPKADQERYRGPVYVETKDKPNEPAAEGSKLRFRGNITSVVSKLGVTVKCNSTEVIEPEP